MADIYLLGHGEWQSRGTAKAFCQVPKNTSVVFYTPVGRFINSDQTAEIMRGDPNALEPYQTIRQFKQCPNLTLSDGVFGDEITALLRTGVRFARVLVPTSLEDLMEKYAGNKLHWLACRVMFGHLDTTQGGFNDDYRPGTGVGV